MGPIMPNCSLFTTGTNTCAATPMGLFVSVSTMPTGGACAASVVMPVGQPPKWTTNVVACAPPAPSVPCGSGICAPAPTNPSSFKRCVFRLGDLACPPGPYTDKKMIDTSFDDERHCSACACGAPNPTCSGGKAVLTSHTNCSSTVDVDVPTSCAPFATQAAWGPIYAVLTVPPTAGGACVAAGGAPSGSVKSTGATTICCM